METEITSEFANRRKGTVEQRPGSEAWYNLVKWRTYVNSLLGEHFLMRKSTEFVV